jgi:CheY-like chemotaxis protein
MQVILRNARLRVSATGDSSEVLQLVAIESFDALLLDNWMPEGDDFHAFERP